METIKIYVTAADKAKLKRLFGATAGYRPGDQKTVMELLKELERAEVIEGDIKPDVIRMNSTVTVEDIDTGKEMTYTIVYPEQADLTRNCISILAPVGTALLGYSAGDKIEWQVPAGKRRLKIKKVDNLMA